MQIGLEATLEIFPRAFFEESGQLVMTEMFQVHRKFNVSHNELVNIVLAGEAVASKQVGLNFPQSGVHGVGSRRQVHWRLDGEIALFGLKFDRFGWRRRGRGRLRMATTSGARQQPQEAGQQEGASFHGESKGASPPVEVPMTYGPQ